MWPSYPGGDTALAHFIQANIKYPDSSMFYGIEGRVLVKFKVLRDGSTGETTVVRGLDKYINAESLRVINLLHFAPFKPSDTCQSSSVVLPIENKISNR